MPASTIAYATDCPKCARELQPVALVPDSAPWLCNECHLGFWAAELTDEARACYKPPLVEFAGKDGAVVRRAVQSEWLHAQARGCSLRPDQLREAHKDHLVGAREQVRLLADNFAAAIDEEIARRG